MKFYFHHCISECHVFLLTAPSPMIRWLLQAKQAHREIGLTSRPPKCCSDKAKKSLLPVTIAARTQRVQSFRQVVLMLWLILFWFQQAKTGKEHPIGWSFLPRATPVWRLFTCVHTRNKPLFVLQIHLPCTAGGYCSIFFRDGALLGVDRTVRNMRLLSGTAS